MPPNLPAKHQTDNDLSKHNISHSSEDTLEAWKLWNPRYESFSILNEASMNFFKEFIHRELLEKSGDSMFSTAASIPSSLSATHYADVHHFNMTNASSANGSLLLSDGEDSVSMTAAEWIRDSCLGLVLAFLSLLTFVGNAMVLHAVRTERRLQTVSNMFIVSLAIADLTVGLIVMPISTVYIFTTDWLYGVVLCQFWIAVDYTASTASILNLFILSLDRYWSVTSPLKYMRRRTKRRALVMISMVWFVSSLWIIPIIAWHHFEHGGVRTVPTSICDTEYAKNTSLKIITGILNYYLPLAFMYGLYIKIFMEIHKRSKMEIGQRSVGGAVTHENPIISGSLSDVSAADNETVENTLSNGGPAPHPMRLRIYNLVKSSNSAIRSSSGSNNAVTDSETIHTDEETMRLNEDAYKHAKRRKISSSSYAPGSDEDKAEPSLLRADELFGMPKGGGLGRGLYEELSMGVIGGSNRRNSGDCEESSSNASESCLNTENAGLIKGDDSGKVRFKEDVSGDEKFHSKILPKENHPNKNKYVKPRFVLQQRITESFTGDSRGSEHNTGKLLTVTAKPNRMISSKLQNVVTKASCSMQNNNNNASLHNRHNRKHSALVAQARRWKKKAEKKYHKPSSALSKEIKAARQLGVIMGAFTLCFFPYFVCFMVVAFCSACVSSNLMTAVTWVGYLNSTLNPFLYPLCNATFRHKFRKMLGMKLTDKEMQKSSAYYAAVTNSVVRNNQCFTAINPHVEL